MPIQKAHHRFLVSQESYGYFEAPLLNNLSFSPKSLCIKHFDVIIGALSG